MITEIEDFFALGCGRCARFATPDCSVQHWQQGLVALRRICVEAGLQEAVKWGHPVYMHAGRNVAIIAAFRGDFRISFMNAALLDDPAGLLQRQGPNAPQADAMRFTNAAQVPAQAAAIAGFLHQAKGFAAAGVKPAKVVAALVLPDELRAALEDDPRLAAAFHALTPGRQRSHVLQISGAKATATRAARVAKLAPRILAGKGAQDY